MSVCGSVLCAADVAEEVAQTIEGSLAVFLVDEGKLLHGIDEVAQAVGTIHLALELEYFLLGSLWEGQVEDVPVVVDAGRATQLVEHGTTRLFAGRIETDGHELGFALLQRLGQNEGEEQGGIAELVASQVYLLPVDLRSRAVGLLGKDTAPGVDVDQRMERQLAIDVERDDVGEKYIGEIENFHICRRVVFFRGAKVVIFCDITKCFGRKKERDLKLFFSPKNRVGAGLKNMRKRYISLPEWPIFVGFGDDYA